MIRTITTLLMLSLASVSAVASECDSIDMHDFRVICYANEYHDASMCHQINEQSDYEYCLRVAK